MLPCAKSARSQEDTRDLKIEVDHSPESVSIRVIRPSTGMRHWNYGATFAIKVPHGVVLEHVTTSNGAIRAADGAGPARLKTSNGHVEGNRFPSASSGPVRGCVTGITARHSPSKCLTAGCGTT